MKINEFVLKEDYPGLALSLANNINRLARAYQQAAKDEDNAGRILSQWARDFYIQGNRMDKEGQTGQLEYLVRTAKENGTEIKMPNIQRQETKEKRKTPPAKIANIMANFYMSEIPSILASVPEFTDEEKDRIASAVRTLASSRSSFSDKPTRRSKPKGDEYDGSYDDPSNELRGSQNRAAMQAVNAVLAQVAQQHGKDQAHKIRQAVQRAGNPLQALQVELNKAGITLSESVISKLNQLLEVIK